MIRPSFEEFSQLTGQGNLVPVFREIFADLDTPLSAFMKVAGERPYAFLLESVHGGEKWGRYSFLGADPAMLFRVTGHHITIERAGYPSKVVRAKDPVAFLREEMALYRPVHVKGLPRFHGGAVGYLGYDMVRHFEQLPDNNPDHLKTPDALFLLTHTVVIFDNLLCKIKVVDNVFVDEDKTSKQLYDEALIRIQHVVDRLNKPLPVPSSGRWIQAEVKPVLESDFRSEMSREAFEDAVMRAKEYIVAGDIMQVVLSQRLTIPFKDPPIDLYRALRATNPSPYLFYLRCGSFSIVGSSPEILVRKEEDVITVRPIAGTRPRGETDLEDRDLEKSLLDDPKERAEHMMLLDLGRNDLGRVAVIGTVDVTEQFAIERYSHVMHIVSNVEARLRRGLDAMDVLAATFPAGTVSGAPKIRAMEIIDELEVSRRGPYAGAVGYLSYAGNMDTAIAIRTAIIKDNRLAIQAGAGIVADSVPEMEFHETMNKARAIFRAVDLVRRGLE